MVVFWYSVPEIFLFMATFVFFYPSEYSVTRKFSFYDYFRILFQKCADSFGELLYVLTGGFKEILLMAQYPRHFPT